MASNIVNWQNYQSIPAGTATWAVGIGPGLNTPSALLESLVTGSLTITLPPINDVLPSPPTTSQLTQGVYSDFTMTIFNTGGGTITTTPYSGDASLPSAISVTASANHSVTIKAEAATSTWYVIAST